MIYAISALDSMIKNGIISPMPRLEDITVGSQVKGLIPGDVVTVKHVQMFGDQALEVTYTNSTGRSDSQLLYRDQEAGLEIVQQARAFSFTADSSHFRLAAEAHRIRLGYLFDPLIAISTSAIDPLPHQMTAVYETMLSRQPLRFLLADDPGAGKTIMTGLLLKELIIRGDVMKCLIVAPGSLVEQWQDELDQKFSLPFDIMTNDAIATSRTGNWFVEHDLCLCRLDKLSRNEDLQAQVAAVDWDLVIFDEAHKLSATYFGGEVKTTKRFRLGRLLSEHTRQLLLLTATPHNGKEEDFQLFLSILDGDRFEGKPRDAAHTIDAHDLMRRMVKEQLVTMEGKPLFPDRFAYTLNFDLSDLEAALYEQVTNYVRQEFNRADNLEKGRQGTIGFALTILQRRLASSPEAIYQSLKRRRERLERRLKEEQILRRGAEANLSRGGAPELTEDDIEDLEDAPESEIEVEEERILDAATASRTIVELEKEIATLQRLEKLAVEVRKTGTDTKWQKLSDALQDNPLMFTSTGDRRKLIIFTEHRDTLAYLRDKLTALLGNPDAVVVIHGQTPRDQRRAIQESFSNNPDVLILVATDAAGEGVNLQRAHLMINYDLPWNPNRLEQRFGRIHRIGQREVCHLWNLVADGTREGDVFARLLDKLERERSALGGAVFDVLGKVFMSRSLKEILIEAIRKGDEPEVKAKLDAVIDAELDHERLRQLLDDRSLAEDSLGSSRVQEIREMMDRAEARRLQPHYVGSFFHEAFASLGGRLQPREDGRFEIRNVPFEVRQRDRVTGRRAPVLKAYERITFFKEKIRMDGKPPAALIAPGHPLLDSVTDLVLEKRRGSLREGAVLIDPNSQETTPRVLLCLESAITESATRAADTSSSPRVVSRRMQFVELLKTGEIRPAGYAPYLDYEAPTPEQLEKIKPLLTESWLGGEIERQAAGYSIQHLIPDHLREVRIRREHHIAKAIEQVHERLTREIIYWNNRAAQLELQEQAGKTNAKLNANQARQRADNLAERLRSRMERLEAEKKLVALPPTVPGAALVIPAGWFESVGSSRVAEEPPTYGRNNKESEATGMAAVMAAEKSAGFEPADVSKENRGYDIESRDPATGHLRFIEVKGRAAGADTITLTRNEVLTALNKPESWYLAIVSIEQGVPATPIYLKEPFRDGLEFAAASMNLRIADLIASGGRE